MPVYSFLKNGKISRSQYIVKNLSLRTDLSKRCADPDQTAPDQGLHWTVSPDVTGQFHLALLNGNT